MTLRQNEEAQSVAPSYLHLGDDGADWHCEICGKFGRRGFVKPFTPDGKLHMATHLECLEPEWVASARDMGTAL